MATRVDAKGLKTFKPHENSPEFVLGTIIIEPEEFMRFCMEEGAEWITDYQGRKQIKLQVLKVKEGRGINVQIDTYRKGERDTSKDFQKKSKEDFNDMGNGRDNAPVDDDLPF